MRKILKMAKKPQFILGFELEGAYPSHLDIHDILRPIYSTGYSQSDDVSVDFGKDSRCLETVEIQTPPLPEEEAIKKFFRLRERLVECGFRTNATCGLHVNISEGRLFKKTIVESDSVKKFVWHFGKSFPVYQWRKAFGRTRNGYCKWNREYKKFFEKDWREIHNFHKDVYARGAINSDGLELFSAKFRRLEIRIAGNSGYHCDEKRLLDYLKDIRKYATMAYNSATK